MPEDDELGADPSKTENRSRPDAKSGPDIFREDHARERIEERQRREPPERTPDRDDD